MLTPACSFYAVIQLIGNQKMDGRGKLNSTFLSFMENEVVVLNRSAPEKKSMTLLNPTEPN